MIVWSREILGVAITVVAAGGVSTKVDGRYKVAGSATGSASPLAKCTIIQMKK